MELDLKAKTATEKRVLQYLQDNASEMLALKINTGDKTIKGAMNYATDQARKISAGGSTCVCIEDEVVFGWIIHFFEEDSIAEERQVRGPKVPTGVKVKTKTQDDLPKKVEKVEAPKPPPKPDLQTSMFEALMGAPKA